MNLPKNSPMNLPRLRELPGSIKSFLLAFLLTLAFGYGAGLYFLSDLMGPSPQGVEENYLGSKGEPEEGEKMKFKMSERELFITIHDHVLSLSLIFLVLGSGVLLSGLPSKLKSFLCFEPFLSIIVTFGGIWILWTGVTWMRYLILISGALMHLSALAMFLIIGGEMLKRPSSGTTV